MIKVVDPASFLAGRFAIACRRCGRQRHGGKDRIRAWRPLTGMSRLSKAVPHAEAKGIGALLTVLADGKVFHKGHPDQWSNSKRDQKKLGLLRLASASIASV